MGYKIILPVNYPQVPPLVYVDEPQHEEVISKGSYVTQNYRIQFEELQYWSVRFS